MIAFSCPNCNAPLECEDSKEFWFCHHCSYKCFLSDDRIKTNINYNTNVTLNGDASEYIKAMSDAEREKIISSSPELLKLQMQLEESNKTKEMIVFLIIIIMTILFL